MNFQASALLTVLFQALDSVQDLHTTPSLLIQKEVCKMSKSISISYRHVGDYKIPNIILPPEQANITIGKWGIMHKDYLEHSKRGLFMLMVTKCTLWPYLEDIDRQANEMYDLLIEHMKEAEDVTEELKEQDRLEWVQRMGNIQQRAKEIVCRELIYV